MNIQLLHGMGLVNSWRDYEELPLHLFMDAVMLANYQRRGVEAG
jgi:hypothetical protein